MSNKLQNKPDPKNNDEIIYLGDSIKIEFQLFITNTRYKKINFNKKAFRTYIEEMTDFYFDRLASKQKKAS